MKGIARRLWVGIVASSCLVAMSTGFGKELPPKAELKKQVEALQKEVQANEKKLQELKGKLADRNANLAGNDQKIAESLHKGTVVGAEVRVDAGSCEEVWFNEGKLDSFNISDNPRDYRSCGKDRVAIGLQSTTQAQAKSFDRRFGTWCCKIYVSCPQGYQKGTPGKDGYTCYPSK